MIDWSKFWRRKCCKNTCSCIAFKVSVVNNKGALYGELLYLLGVGRLDVASYFADYRKPKVFTGRGPVYLTFLICLTEYWCRRSFLSGVKARGLGEGSVRLTPKFYGGRRDLLSQYRIPLLVGSHLIFCTDEMTGTGEKTDLLTCAVYLFMWFIYLFILTFVILWRNVCLRIIVASWGLFLWWRRRDFVVMQTPA